MNKISKSISAVVLHIGIRQRALYSRGSFQIIFIELI